MRFKVLFSSQMQLARFVLSSFLMLSVFGALGFKVSTPDYCYKGLCSPYYWGKNFPSCTPSSTQLQSPIDLSDAVIKQELIPPLKLKGFTMVQSSWTVANVRDSVVVDFKEGMTMKGGNLTNEYRVVEMKFHWGTTETNGSEHTLNNRRFPMEMQIMGVAPGVTDGEAAFLKPKSVAILGVFIDIGNTENRAFKVISDALVQIQYPGDSVNVTPPALLRLFPEESTKTFYYQGGQTTPPCNQTVSWVVLEKPIFISREQYLKFATSLYYSEKNSSEWKLEENYRPIQSNANRQVYASAAAKLYLARGSAKKQHAAFIPLLILTTLVHFDL